MILTPPTQISGVPELPLRKIALKGVILKVSSNSQIISHQSSIGQSGIILLLLFTAIRSLDVPNIPRRNTIKLPHIIPRLLINIPIMIPIIYSHEHPRHLHHPHCTITQPASHPGQIRSAIKIPGSTPRVEPISTTTIHVRADHAFELGRKSNANFREEFRECAACDQGHDDEEEYFHGVAFHVVV